MIDRDSWRRVHTGDVLPLPYAETVESLLLATRVYERDLFPYGPLQKPDDQHEDDYRREKILQDNLLKKRLYGGNRIFRNVPELREELRQTLAADDDESIRQLAELFELARSMYTPENERPINSLFAYLSFNDELLRASLEVEGSGPRVNAIAALSRRMFTDAYDEAQLPEVIHSITYLSQRIENAFSLPEEKSDERRFQVDLLGLHGSVCKRFDALRYVDHLADDTAEYSKEEVSRDSEVVGELFGELRASQRYGVKMGYVQHSYEGTLVFSPIADPDEIRRHIQTYHPLMAEEHSVATVVHNRKSRHDTIKHTSTKIMDGLFMFGRPTSPDDIASFAIGEDGELYTDADCRTSLVAIAHQKGKYEAYRRFHAEVLAHYYDATHSLDDVIKAKKIIATVAEEADPSTPASPMDTMGRLVIPRVRNHQAQPTPTAQELIEDRPKKSVRAHGVTWHIRELPEGWHASPSAQELAASLGIRLGPHETIVKSHRRGSEALGEVTAHMLVGRPTEE